MRPQERIQGYISSPSEGNTYKLVNSEHSETMRQMFLGLILLGITLPTTAAIWDNRNQWNDGWEDRYSQWVKTNYQRTFFTQGKYANMPHDCADSVYFARLVFAYEHRLPFKILDPRYPERDKLIAANPEMFAENAGKSPYATIQEYISNDFTYYDELPEADRLRKFMLFVGDVVGTNSLMNDTYPILLDRRWFRPGVVAALPRLESKLSNSFFQNEPSYGAANESAGHAQIVTDLDQYGVVHYLKSTVPAKIQEFKHTTLNSFVPSAKGGSFRWWRQPQQYGVAEERLPGYGIDQYQLSGVFEDALQKKLAMTQEGDDQRFLRLADEVCQQIEQRVPVVKDAWDFKQGIGSRCMDYKEFDAYSTPSRDAKIKKALQYLLQSASGSENASISGIEKYLNQACGRIQYLPGKSISAADFAARLMAGKASSDPNQAPAVRWGDQEPAKLGCQQFY